MSPRHQTGTRREDPFARQHLETGGPAHPDVLGDGPIAGMLALARRADQLAAQQEVQRATAGARDSAPRRAPPGPERAPEISATSRFLVGVRQVLEHIETEHADRTTPRPNGSAVSAPADAAARVFRSTPSMPGLPRTRPRARPHRTRRRARVSRTGGRRESGAPASSSRGRWGRTSQVGSRFAVVVAASGVFTAAVRRAGFRHAAIVADGVAGSRLPTPRKCPEGASPGIGDGG